MNRKLKIILSAFAVSALAFSALAEDTLQSKMNESHDTRDRRANSDRLNRLNDVAKTSDLLGMSVKNYQDETLGKVEELAVDVESGRIVQVILSVGGFMGIGDLMLAVPPGALDHDIANKALYLDADKEKLKSGPKFEMSKWAEYSGSNHLSEVYRHYGEETSFLFIQREGEAVNGPHNTEGSTDTVSTRKADGTGVNDLIPNESQSMIPMSRLSNLQRIGTLMGMPVENLQNEKLGKVENILIDLASGRIVAVILSSGGFLGMGGELSAVPPAALRFSMDRKTFQLDASKDMLINAPHFKSDQWPDFSRPAYAGEFYRAYQVDPYFKAATEPDNTVRNLRDRDGSTLTPFDQGNSKTDVETTAQIRQEIVAGENMSVNAKNVKIITNQGQVTLRGPVNSAEEKRFIGAIATRIARLDNVNNELEVKRVPSAINSVK